MGHNDVECETRGGVLLNNWPSDPGRRSKIGARSVTPYLPAKLGMAVEDAEGSVGRALPVVVAGTASLGLPLVLHSAVLHAPTLRPALEMMLTLISLSAAWLLRTQFMDSRRLRDLLLLCVTLALGLMNLFINTLPAALDLRNGAYLAAAGLWGQLFLAGIFAAAAAVSRDRVVERREHPARIGTVLALAPLVGAMVGGLVTRGLGLDLRPHAGTGSGVMLFILVLATTGLLAYAAGALTREHLRRPDGVVALLSASALLLAGAAMSHLTTRSLPGSAVNISTGMRLMAVAVLLWAAVTLERRVGARAERAAALAERHRVARDLHDGIAQDLAFIAAHGAQMAAEMGDEHPVVVAARRALAISRSTISDLSDPAGASVREALDAIAEELRNRFDVAIAVHTQIDGHLASGVREHLSRITREAIANAARHGHARNVLVSLRRAEGRLALRIIDDGCGIPVGDDGTNPEGFGLRSMRERAGTLGGSLTVRRAPEGGTVLEVVLP